jgi:XTP/dITP diphosphohydrolase
VEKIIIASKNVGKIKEIKDMFNGMDIEILSLKDFPEFPDIVEDGKSFYENALKKAKTVQQATGETALADDSGLEVEALRGAPGVYSARYAGEHADDGKNMAKLLADMKGITPDKRQAAFHCVLVVCANEGCRTFEGYWKGLISESPAGKGGFGYDPVFYLPDKGVTVAQLLPETKNMLSHRAQAFRQFKNDFMKDAHKKVPKRTSFRMFLWFLLHDVR